MPVYIFRKTAPQIVPGGRFSFAAESGGGKPVVSVNDTFRFTDNGPSAYMITAGSKSELIHYLLDKPNLNFTVEGTEPEKDDYDFDDIDDTTNTMAGITIHWVWRSNFDPKVSTTNVNAGRAAFNNIVLGVAGGFGVPSSGIGVGAAEAFGDAAATAVGFMHGGSATSGGLALELNIVADGTNTGKQSVSARRLASIVAPERVKRVKKRP